MVSSQEYYPSSQYLNTSLGRHREFDIQKVQFPGMIQPHGFLMVLEEPYLKITQVSDNIADFLKVSPEDCLNQPLKDFFSPSQIKKIDNYIKNNPLGTSTLIKFRIKIEGKYISFNGIIHRNSAKLLILELEPYNSQELNFQTFYNSIRLSTQKLHQTKSLPDLCQTIVEEVKKVIQFDRLMIYKFDQDWHGDVIAEAKREDLKSFLGLHFPEEDTGSCRHLYGINWLRLIPDVQASPIKIIPTESSITNSPLDLTYSHFRGVHPCHVEYLENMGVKSSLALSIMKGNRLWGLIAGHHYDSAKYLSYEVCQACEFLGQIMSIEILAKEEQEHYAHKIQLKSIQTQLTESLSTEEELIEAFVKNESDLLNLVGATGIVIAWNDEYKFLGKTPEQQEVMQLLPWLKKEIKTDYFSSTNLSSIYPQAEAFYQEASGLLLISISDTKQILWFRPEVIQTVNWAGDPYYDSDPIETDEGLYIRPRKSFESWKEIVKHQSLPWQEGEIEAAKELRNTLVRIVIRQINELEKLNRKLETSNKELEKFAYVASHDLQEPLNLVASYVQLLEMRYEAQLDQDAKDFIGFAVEGVSHMQTLIDDLLAYSRVGSRGKPFTSLELETIIQRVLRNLQGRIDESQATVTYDPLPTVVADETQLTQIFQNLIGNAIKFRAKEPPRIHISVTKRSKDWLLKVQDNGIGIDPQFAERIFVIFQRLHTRDNYPGTGIGLAICKKIVERHEGEIWLESESGKGSIFHFTIPFRNVVKEAS